VSPGFAAAWEASRSAPAHGATPQSTLAGEYIVMHLLSIGVAPRKRPPANEAGLSSLSRLVVRQISDDDAKCIGLKRRTSR
jgi:hypothetical protein